MATMYTQRHYFNICDVLADANDRREHLITRLSGQILRQLQMGVDRGELHWDSSETDFEKVQTRIMADVVDVVGMRDDILLDELCKNFEQDNERFNREKFEKTLIQLGV